MALTGSQKKNAERNRKYWADREAKALKHRITDEKQYDKQLEKIYSDMLDSVQREINAFYGKYADKEGITLAEAKKRVSKLDIEAYERKAKRYVKDAELDRKVNGGKTNKQGYYFSPQAEEEMRLYNLTMKVNRLEMLKANIGLELIQGHQELENFMADILQGRTEDELERQAGILGKTIKNNAQKANAIVNASFHNATFSDRIWQYQTMMKADLSKLLQSGMIQGKNPRALARDLKKQFNTSTYNAERLMRTELARVQTDAQKQSFERNGFDEYMFITNGGCCDICAGLDGKHFKVSKMMPGLNAPPMHPHCRCSVAAYEDSEEYEAWLDYLSKGGKTVDWDNRLKIEFPGNTKSYKRSLKDIAEGKAGLSEKRQNMLNRLNESGASCRYARDTVSVRDLAYLSAATNNEFALFRSKTEDIIIRGTAKSCDVVGDLGDEILSKKYIWVAHSHIDKGNLVPSIADRETLKRLGQKKSIIVGIDGEEVEFYLSPFDF